MKEQMQKLSGWGRTPTAMSNVVTPESPEELRSALRHFAPGALRSGMIARGLGRSYGDAAQCSGGTVFDMSGQEVLLREDLESGVISVSSGMSINSLLTYLIPKGWFLPVTPGTSFVTLGGALACDVHGKNHHQDGSIGSHVREFKLLTPSGIVNAKPSDDTSEIFWATVGGLGLTGIVEQVELSLLPIESDQMLVTTQRAQNLDELIELMSSTDNLYRYSVAWIDCLATGGALGRSVLTQANHATSSDMPRKTTRGVSGLLHQSISGFRNSTSKQLRTRISIPVTPPVSTLNRLSVSAFNEVWYRKSPAKSCTELSPIPKFFYPLDAIGHWNRLYGKNGFIQYQFVVPFGCEPELRSILEILSSSRLSSFLAVLKRFGLPSGGYLSFPTPGWTLAVDIGLANPRVGSILDQLDEIVVGAKGRVYLAKDSRLDPRHVERMYPELEKWRAIRDRLDPKRLMASDLSRRLELI